MSSGVDRFLGRLSLDSSVHGVPYPAASQKVFADELPLALPLKAERLDRSAVGHQTIADVLQSSPESPLSSTAEVGSATPPGNGQQPPLGTVSGASQGQVDLDELVEKAWDKLMRKLSVEQERRGVRWVSW
jgi:hypothetical protein